MASTNATLVSSTRPSGTMPTRAATVPVTASCQLLLSLLRNWLHSRIGPTTSMTSEIQRSSRFVPATSSERVTVKRRASVASLVAYASAPTAVAWNRPWPATTIDPDRTWSLGRLRHRIGLAGQQRLVDLEAGRLAHDAVGGQLIAGAKSEQVVGHDVRDLDVVLVAVAHDAGARRVQDGQPVERPLRAQFLDDADCRVGDDDERRTGRSATARSPG